MVANAQISAAEFAWSLVVSWVIPSCYTNALVLTSGTRRTFLHEIFKPYGIIFMPEGLRHPDIRPYSLRRPNLMEVRVLSANELFRRTIRLEQNVDTMIRSQTEERRGYFIDAVSGFVIDAITVNQKQILENSNESIFNLKRFLEDEFRTLSVTTEFMQIAVQKANPSGFEVVMASYLFGTMH